jgi:hypothetical protein
MSLSRRGIGGVNAMSRSKTATSIARKPKEILESALSSISEELRSSIQGKIKMKRREAQKIKSIEASSL